MPADHEPAGGARPLAMNLLASLVARTFLLGVMWWALAEGEIGNPVFTALAVFVATLASFSLLPPRSWRWQPGGFVRFLPFFLVQSFLGGVDVGLRALRPGPPILPGFVDYPLHLPDGPARVFFVTAFSLLPGTLSVEIRGDGLRVHLLHRRISMRERTEQLERRVGALFGVEI